MECSPSACLLERPVRRGTKRGAGCQEVLCLCRESRLDERRAYVVFFLVCDITTNVIWRQFQIPTYIISSDGGYTWSEPSRFCSDRGRIYDAKYYNGEILALNFKNDNEINFLGNKPEDVYELYVSRDGGQTFQKRSELPFDTLGKSYGTMCMLESGSLIVYIYNADDEHNADYVVSDDFGRTWSDVKTAYFARSCGTLRWRRWAAATSCMDEAAARQRRARKRGTWSCTPRETAATGMKAST